MGAAATGFAGFFAAVAAGLGFAFELTGRGLFRRGRRFRGRGRLRDGNRREQARRDQGGGQFQGARRRSKHGRGFYAGPRPPLTTFRNYQRVSTVRRSVRGSTGWKCRSSTGAPSPGNWLS